MEGRREYKANRVWKREDNSRTERSYTNYETVQGSEMYVVHGLEQSLLLIVGGWLSLIFVTDFQS